MITGVTGILEAKGPDWVQVRIGGSVSLQVFVPSSAVDELGGTGDQVHLHTQLAIRDDEAVLYGFSTAAALRLFRQLNGVAGIGPRISLALLSTLGPHALVTAVVMGDVGSLSKVPGVGIKSAGRLVLELKGKLEKELDEAPMLASDGDNGEVLSALMALGYTAAECRRAVASVGKSDGLTLEEKVRGALQQLAGG